MKKTEITQVVLCATFSSERRVPLQLLHSLSAPVPTSSYSTAEFNEVEHETREKPPPLPAQAPVTMETENDHASSDKTHLYRLQLLLIFGLRLSQPVSEFRHLTQQEP